MRITNCIRYPSQFEGQHSNASALWPLAARAQQATKIVAAPPSSVMNSRRSHSITSSARASSDGGTFEAERLRGLEIDDQFEFGRLYDGKVSWPLALENATCIDADLLVCTSKARAIAHQTASSGELAVVINGGDFVACRQGSELIAAAGEKRIGNDDEGAGPLLHDICKGYFKIAFAAGVNDAELLSKQAGCFANIS